MARIEIYSNDSNVTLDDKVIGTDALDNSTKNFTVGDMLALASASATYTAGNGIDITNNVISSTVVDTDTNNFISNVALNGTDLDFTGTGGAYNSSVPLAAIADKTVSLTGINGVAVTGTYPSFTIDGSSAGVAPETLILKIANVSPIGITSAPGTELDFASAGALVNSNSVHINQTDLNLANATDIEVVADCTVKISLGAYMDNGGQAGQITFLIYEVSGAQTLVGSASFDLSNQAVGVIPTTFFSFFDFQAGEIYKFTAYSTQHAMTIVPGSFIQIEVLK